MTETSRDQTLRKIGSFYTGVERTGDLDWIDIGFLCEGIAFAQRPLREGNQETSKRYNLGPRGAFILNLLASGMRYPLELATALRCGRSLITAELARLTDAGLVTSRAGEVDRRRTELTLTEPGEQALAEIRAETSRIIRANLADYTPDEIRKFAMMLRAVRGEPVLTEPLMVDPELSANDA
jgi:DNA-binding MarR family transcriptional regulator